MASKALRILFVTLLCLACLIAALVGGLAIWYQAPFASSLRMAAAVTWAALLVGGALMAILGWRMRVLVAGTAVVLCLGLWWQGIAPSNERDFAPDVARAVTGEITGNTLRMTNVRDFRWSAGDAPGVEKMVEHWDNRTYDLDKLRTVDLFTIHWMGEQIAHVILSFGFDDGRHLAWSIEVRRHRGDVYSAIAGFFKQAELVFIAADERDVIGVRAQVRDEDVRLYRLTLSPAQARVLLTSYVQRANALAAHPQWYNTLTANCTTGAFQLAQAVAPGIPLDWRVLASGYLPDYVYDQGGMGRSWPFLDLRALAPISDLGRTADMSSEEAFSRDIRARHVAANPAASKQ